MSLRNAIISVIFLNLLPFVCQVAPVLRAQDVQLDIRLKIQNFTPEEKQALERNTQRFQELDGKERDRLRKLNTEIEASPDSQDLLRVLEAFSHWFQQLSPEERVRFRNVTNADERLVLVKNIMEEHRQKEKRLAEEKRHQEWKAKVDSLSAQDAAVLYEWVKSFITKNEQRIMYSMPLPMKNRLETITDKEKRAQVLMSMVFMKMPNMEAVRPERDEFVAVSEKLSPAARQLLDEQTDPGQKHQLFHSWVLKVIWEKSYPHVSEKVLKDFLQQRMPTKARLMIETLPPDERERELKQIYAVMTFLGLRANEWDDRMFDPGPPRGFGGPDNKGGELRPPRFGDFFKRPGERLPPNGEPMKGEPFRGEPPLNSFDDSPKPSPR
jgi:hypothetical protein